MGQGLSLRQERPWTCNCSIKIFLVTKEQKIIANVQARNLTVGSTDIDGRVVKRVLDHDHWASVYVTWVNPANEFQHFNTYDRADVLHNITKAVHA